MEQQMTIGALVLAGGQNTRMDGYHKARLELHGQSFLSRLDAAFFAFPERLLATNVPTLANGTSFTAIPDCQAGQGPLGGLASALAACRSDALIVCACDMPFFSAEAAVFLSAQLRLNPTAHAIALKDRQGRLHPLCGIYQKSCLPIIQTMLAEKDYRVMRLFQMLKSLEIGLFDTQLPDLILMNVNTPEALADAIATAAL